MNSEELKEIICKLKKVKVKYKKELSQLYVTMYIKTDKKFFRFCYLIKAIFLSPTLVIGKIVIKFNRK